MQNYYFFLIYTNIFALIFPKSAQRYNNSSYLALLERLLLPATDFGGGDTEVLADVTAEVGSGGEIETVCDVG